MEGLLNSSLSEAEVELLVPKVNQNLCIGYKYDEVSKFYEVTSIDNTTSFNSNKGATVNVGDRIVGIWNITVDKCTYAQFQDIVLKSGGVVLLKFKRADGCESENDHMKMEISSSSSLNNFEAIDESKLLSGSGKPVEDVPNIISTFTSKDASKSWDSRWYCLGGNGLGK